MYPYQNRTGGFVPPDHPSQQQYDPRMQYFGSAYQYNPNYSQGSLGVVNQPQYSGNPSGLVGGVADSYGLSFDSQGNRSGGIFNSGLDDFESGIMNKLNKDAGQLFGEDISFGQALVGGSSGKSVSDQRVYGPQDQLFANQYYPYISNLINAFGGDPSQLIQGFTPTQQLGQQLGANTALGLQGQVGQTNQAYSQALDPSSAFNSPLYQKSLLSTLNPFVRTFQQDINPVANRFNEDINSTLRNFNQNALAGIRDQAVGVGQVGSSREGIAQGIAGQDLADAIRGIGRGVNDTYSGLTRGFADNLGNISSQFAQNAFNQGINQRLGALGLAPQIGQYNFMPSQYLQDIGATQQGLGQQYRQAPLTFASQIQQLLGDPTVLSRQESRETSTRGLSQGFNDIFGGSGGAMFGGF